MSGFVNLASQYMSGKYAMFIMQTQTTLAKKFLDFNLGMQQQIIQQLSQGVQSLQSNNNPTNTGVFLDIKA